jgi:hypothetical protein
LELDSQGRIVGPNVSYGTPWPTLDGEWSFIEPAWGMVFHTEVGYEHNVIAEFENPGSKASAFGSVAFDGHLTQYGPIGKGWMAWTQAVGNPHYRGFETEDGGDPTVPWTLAQVETLASVFELLSRVDGFPLQVTDDPNGGRGGIFHSDGGQAWGGHDCPGNVRRGLRGAVLTRALEIRSESQPVVQPHTYSGGPNMRVDANISASMIVNGKGWVDVEVPPGVGVSGEPIINGAQALDGQALPRADWVARDIGGGKWRVNFSGLAGPCDVHIPLG